MLPTVPNHRPAQVLIAEDDGDQATLLTRWLESTGRFEVTVASDGTTAAELLGTQPWSLVISDIELPGLDGFELARRNHTSRHRSSLLLVTAHESSDYLRRAIDNHVDGFLSKPLTRDMLVDRADQLLETLDYTPEPDPIDWREKALALQQAVRSTAEQIGGITVPVGLLADWTPDVAGLVRSYDDAVSDVVRQLTEVAKSVELPRTAHDLGVIAGDAATFAHEYSQVPVRTRIPAHTAPIYADSSQLRDALASLMLVVAQAPCFESVRGLNVFIGSDATREAVELVVSGESAPGGAVARFANDFYTLPAPLPGHGFSMSACNSIVARHNGRLMVEARPDGFACVVVLPLATQQFPLFTRTRQVS